MRKQNEAPVLAYKMHVGVPVWQSGSFPTDRLQVKIALHVGFGTAKWKLPAQGAALKEVGYMLMPYNWGQVVSSCKRNEKGRQILPTSDLWHMLCAFHRDQSPRDAGVSSTAEAPCCHSHPVGDHGQHGSGAQTRRERTITRSVVPCRGCRRSPCRWTSGLPPSYPSAGQTP